MKIVHIAIAAGIAVGVPAVSHAQGAGSTLLGVSYSELRDVAMGWSAKRQILGHPVRRLPQQQSLSEAEPDHPNNQP